MLKGNGILRHLKQYYTEINKKGARLAGEPQGVVGDGKTRRKTFFFFPPEKKGLERAEFGKKGDTLQNDPQVLSLADSYQDTLGTLRIARSEAKRFIYKNLKGPVLSATDASRPSSD